MGRVLSCFLYSQSQNHPVQASWHEQQRCWMGAVTLQCGRNTVWPLYCFPSAVGGGTPWVQPQGPWEQGGTEQSHSGSVPPLPPHPKLSPFCGPGNAQALPGDFQGLHLTCLDLVFPGLPQDFWPSPSPLSASALGRFPSVLCGAGAAHPPLGTALAPSGEQQIHKLGTNLSSEPQSFNLSWREELPAGPGSQASPAGRKLMESKSHVALEFSMPFMLVGE